jgi:tetratricopeptide (TPR) repeat protein
MVGVQALCNLVTFHLYVGDFPTAEALLKEAREDLLTRIKDPTRLRMQERTLLYFTRAGVSAREGVLHRVRGEFGPALECFAAAAADGELSLSGPGFAQDATRQTGLTLALQKRRNQSSGGKPSDPIVDGLFYLRTGDFPKAADSYRAALQQNTEPRNWSLEGGLGLALHRAQEVDEATKHLSEARSYIAMIRANLPEKFRVSFEDASWNGIGVHEVLEVATSY